MTHHSVTPEDTQPNLPGEPGYVWNRDRFAHLSDTSVYWLPLEQWSATTGRLMAVLKPKGSRTWDVAVLHLDLDKQIVRHVVTLADGLARAKDAKVYAETETALADVLAAQAG